MIIHHITPADLATLRGIFAFFTEDGWLIPDWIIYLEDNVKCPKPSSTPVRS